MRVETVSLILAAFVDASLAIGAVLRNFRSRLCLSFTFLAAVVFAHDASGVVETLASAAGRWASPRLHVVLTLAVGPAMLVFLRELVRTERRAVERWAWALALSLLGFVPLLTLPIYWRLEGAVFVAAHVLILGPAAVWLGVLAKASGRTELTRDRLRLRYALWGGVICLAFHVTDAMALIGASVPGLGTIARLLYGVFLFQTFIQKELMTAEEAVAKIALFAVIALTLSGIYSLLVSWVGNQPGLFFFNTLIASFVSIVLFDPMRRLTTRMTRRIFLRSNAKLEDELTRLSGEMMGVVEPMELSRRLSKALPRVSGAEGTAFYALAKDGLSFVMPGASAAGAGRFPDDIAASDPVVEYMALRRGRPFVMETVENDRDSFHSAQPRKFCQSCLDSLRRLGADFVIPFVHDSRVVGFSLLSTGERVILTNEQLRLFIPLSRQVGALLKNAETFSLLRNRDKLVAVGEMAAGLAHEIKNPLGAIKGAAQLLKEEIPAGQGASDEYLKILLDETNRLSGVLSDFLDYAKPRRNFPASTCDPIRVIEHTGSLILREAKVNLEVCYERTGIALEADPEILKQVLLNLFLNAVQAMDGYTEKPHLKVTVRELRPRPEFPFGELSLFKIWEGWGKLAGPSERAFVEIEVADNGPGIGAEEMPKIFSPFFTTKPRGTGLGLAICQRLTEGMNGSIAAKRLVPNGTAFTLHLPLRRDKETGATP